MGKSLIKDVPSVKKNLICIVREIGSSEEIAKQKVEMISIIATAHYGAVNGSLIYLCKSKDLQILEKLSPQGKIVLNSMETGKYTTERKRKFGNGNGFLAGRIYRACAS